MHFPTWVVALGIMAGLATGAHATTSFAVEDLGNKFNCSSGCVDTWLIECPDGATHFLASRVRNLLLGSGQDDIFEVTTIGFTGSLVGVADREVSPSSAGGTSNFSIPAVLERPGSTQNATKMLVEVGHVVKDAVNAGYIIEFLCLDVLGNDVAKGPVMKLLQDQ